MAIYDKTAANKLLSGKYLNNFFVCFVLQMQLKILLH